MQRAGFIIWLSVLPVAAYGQGFDCHKAATVVEKTICATPDLQMKDAGIAQMYQRARQLDPHNAKMVATQREWLKSRDACGSKAPDTGAVVSCLNDAYDNRQDGLILASGRNVRMW